VGLALRTLGSLAVRVGWLSAGCLRCAVQLFAAHAVQPGEVGEHGVPKSVLEYVGKVLLAVVTVHANKLGVVRFGDVVGQLIALNLGTKV
jgi:hypothetical protein